MTEHFTHSINPFRLSKNRIIRIAEQLTRSYAWLHADFPADFFTINFDQLYDALVYPRYGILLEEGDNLGYHHGEKVLGAYAPVSNTIGLDVVLDDKSDTNHWKKVFTAWHELGHALLHGEWLRTHPGQYHDEPIVTVESAISSNTAERFEQQANLFASHGAAPDWFVDFVLKSTFRLTRPIRYVGPATYWLDVWGRRKLCSVDSLHQLCTSIAYQVRHRFGGLSIEALAYRIKDSVWIEDTTLQTSPSALPFGLLRTVRPTASEVMCCV